jgi:hypothetical protein
MAYIDEPAPPILSNRKLRFEKLATKPGPVSMSRARVPGGWFVHYSSGAVEGVFFYPDPNYEWDGFSLP